MGHRGYLTRGDKFMIVVAIAIVAPVAGGQSSSGDCRRLRHLR